MTSNRPIKIADTSSNCNSTDSPMEDMVSEEVPEVPAGLPVKENEKNKSKLGFCNICVINQAKYNCPACGVKTCSLPCVKTHKDKSNCSGERSKTKLIHKTDMDNLTLLSDYRFLEEIDHKLDDNHRDPLRRHIVVRKGVKNVLPHHLHRLKIEASNRGTCLEYMPAHFSIHQENSTRYHFKEKIIRWHVKWIFHQADITFMDTSIDENTPIIKLLTKYLEPNDSLTVEESEQLAYYHSASYGKIAVLFRSSNKEGHVFEEVFVNKSLRLNLANKTVFEYPVFYVILRDHIHSYLEYETDGHDDLFSEVEGRKEGDDDENMTYF